MKTRLIRIKRTITVLDPQGKDVKVVKSFPCKINASTPSSHRLCEGWK